MSTSEEPPAKRVKTERKLLKNCPANEFLKLTQELYSGPMVLVQVEGREFRVPKALLCYNSTFFEAALADEWKEITEQKVELPDADACDFELIVQWMYHSRIVIPTQQVLKVKESSEEGIKTSESDSGLPEYDIVDDEEDCGGWKIMSYVNFIKLADRITLLGPFDEIFERLEEVLVFSPESLLPEHIRSAATLPTGHRIRKLFAQACVKPYIHDINRDITINDRKEFNMRKEIDEVESFAADLFKEYSLTAREKKVHSRTKVSTFVDPLTNENFTV